MADPEALLWSVAETARLLGLSKQTTWRRETCKKMGLPVVTRKPLHHAEYLVAKSIPKGEMG